MTAGNISDVTITVPDLPPPSYQTTMQSRPPSTVVVAPPAIGVAAPPAIISTVTPASPENTKEE